MMAPRVVGNCLWSGRLLVFELAVLDDVARRNGKVLAMKGWKNRVNLKDARGVAVCYELVG